MIELKKIRGTKTEANAGKQMKFAREYRGYSQKGLCSKIDGLSQSNVSNFENGKGKIGKEQIIKIMDFLNFPIEWLDKELNHSIHW